MQDDGCNSCNDEENCDFQSRNLCVNQTGRKGDPRMHKAVEARLANPDMSLYDALQIGGFEYSEINDSTFLDAEKVSLSQRKNQLSRRLRLRRQQGELNQAQNKKAMSPVKATEEFSSSDISKHYQRHLQTLKANNLDRKSISNRYKRNNHSSECGDSRISNNSEPILRNVYFQTSTESMHEFEHNNSTKHGRNQNLQSYSRNVLLSKDTSSSSHPEDAILAQDPLIQSRFCESVKKSETFSTPIDSVNNLKYPTEPSETFPSKISTELVMQGISSPSLLSSNDFGNGSTRSLSDPCSNLEMSTLNPTLEYQLFSQQNDEISSSKNKLHVALALLQNKRKDIYQKSMLLAGYPPESITDETSAEYRQFVSKAWQEDYRILHDHLFEYQRRKDHEDNSSLTPKSIHTDLGANREKMMYEQQQHLPTCTNILDSYDEDHMDPRPVVQQNRDIHSLDEDFQSKQPILDYNQRLGNNFHACSQSVSEPNIVKRKAYTQDEVGHLLRVDEHCGKNIDEIDEEEDIVDIAEFWIDENKQDFGKC